MCANVIQPPKYFHLQFDFGSDAGFSFVLLNNNRIVLECQLNRVALHHLAELQGPVVKVFYIVAHEEGYIHSQRKEYAIGKQTKIEKIENSLILGLNYRSELAKSLLFSCYQSIGGSGIITTHPSYCREAISIRPFDFQIRFYRILAFLFFFKSPIIKRFRVYPREIGR